MALWDKLKTRGTVEDRRSMAPAVGGLGLGGIALVLLLNYLNGGNVTDVLNQLPLDQLGQQFTQQQNISNTDFAGADNYEVFASTVLGSTNDYWGEVFARNNSTYTPPKLVLFRQATKGGCGISSSDVGPHYCPTDETIYLDETFFDQLQTQFKAKGGDVAESYVIAHEVGHHVQNQLGVIDKVNAAEGSASANELSIKQELQADCYAGLWAHSIRDLGVFEDGEINEALDAASAIGDDKIQQTIEGRITPENWTHGSSEQRVGWFTKGYDTSDVAQCNTF